MSAPAPPEIVAAIAAALRILRAAAPAPTMPVSRWRLAARLDADDPGALRGKAASRWALAGRHDD